MKQNFTIRQGALDGVEAFISVARHRSFRKAAAELGVTPSAMSQAVRALEARVGAALFIRTTRSVGLTEAGERFLSRAQPAFEELVAASEVARDLGQRPAGLLRLTVPRAVVPFLLEPMIGIGWFAAIYFTGGFAGAILSTLLNSPDALAVGASGAIMATLAALFTLSFHAGANRPSLMRRMSGGSLFPALIPAVTKSGAVVDINAHLGGCLTGAAIAFLMLIAWNDEVETPPARSIAATAADRRCPTVSRSPSSSGSTPRTSSASSVRASPPSMPSLRPARSAAWMPLVPS